MIGIAKRGQWNLVKYVYLKPFYWIMVSMSASIALYQLIVKPHYWEKTNHGLHLKPDAAKKGLAKLTKDHSEKFIYPGAIPPEIEHEDISVVEEVEVEQNAIPQSVVGSGAIFMAAAVFSYFLNFVYNVYLGRELENSAFATIALIGSFLYLGQVLFTSLSRTITYKNAFLLGKYQVVISSFWERVKGISIKTGLVLMVVWLSFSWIISGFFNIDSIVPVATFAPVWLLGLVAAVDMGFLAGQMQFASLAFVLIFEAIFKLILTVGFVELNQQYWVYLSLPISMASVAILARFFANKSLKYAQTRTAKNVEKFPRKFFLASIANRIAVVAFLSVDIILAKHFFSPENAGYYSLISLVGKMVFFAGTMVTSFITPLVAKSEGQKNTSKYAFLQLLTVSMVSAGIPALVLTLSGSYFLPLLFAERSTVILPFIGSYLLGIASFAVASNIITYYQAKKSYIFSLAGLFLAFIQIVALVLYHDDLAQMVQVMQFVGIGNLFAVLSLHILIPLTKKIKEYALDVIWLFSSYKPKKPELHKLNFLIFNWRDTQHVWSGGAEVYIHEIAKQWVKDGHKVTLFCGNDGHHERNEVVDGVQIVRRGGFFTVYIWAFVYYVLRFRKLFDVVIDCENGVPFFTPLFVREPKFLLIFHVHQKVFREQLSFPLAQIAAFLESKVMPAVYKKQPVITISESSNHDIINLGLGEPKKIAIIEPGLDQVNYRMSQKTEYPSFLYLGRLKPYKNVDIAIKAFAKVLSKNSDARLTIAGQGESRKTLESLVNTLQIKDSVSFVGRVTEEEKITLLGSSWAALQPSSFEGWGITVIEANACGTPVIASNVEGLRDSVIANKTGILVSKLTSTAFAREMNTLVEDHEKRQELSTAAYSWSKQFNWENSANKFSAFIAVELQKKLYQETSWQK
jgi:glycosyltransferase involved in cell wall biosynthesis/O-antigen/teichoic acid export membrane protein